MRFVILLISIFNMCLIWAKDDDAFIKPDLPKFENDDVFSTSSRPANNWWLKLNDNVLDSLIQLAIDNNQDIYVALDNISAARASHRIAQSAFYPSMTLERGWNYTKGSRNMGDETDLMNDVTQSNWLFAVSASWEIDVFGTIRAMAKEAKYSYEAEIELYNSALLSLTADVATYYANLRMMQQQLIVALKNIESQQEILNITKVRYNSGLASQLDVAQAKSVYFSTKASVPVLQSSIDKQIYTIGLLVSKFPQSLYDWLIVPAEIPQYMDMIAIGTSEQMLANRPDVNAAYLKTKAAKESLNGSKRNFSPQFFIDGSFGFQAQDLNRTFKNKSITYSLSPRISWNFMQGGGNINNLRKKKAIYDSTIRNYNSVVLKATEEVSSAISAYKGRIKQVVSLKELVTQGELTLSLSLDLYKRGLIDFQNVLDAQRSLLEYQNSLVVAEGNTLSALVNLYRALGCY